MGAGILGVTTAWYLLEQGHEVTVIDRQPAAALETSFANGAQISVSYCEPWAHPNAPLKVLKWLTRSDAPLLFRPHLDPHQWSWGLAFLSNCTLSAFERNVAQLVALGQYSHATLRALVAQTGIDYQRLERGILHFFTRTQDLDAAAAGAALMRRHGVDRRVLTREEVVQIEPSLHDFSAHIAGGTFTASDESGDAHVFTQALAQRCIERGTRFLFGHMITRIKASGGAVQGVEMRSNASAVPQVLRADAYVAALGSFTAPLLRPLGVRLAIYPAKGYSATLRLKAPERASTVSLIDDERKVAISRLGDRVRIAGTAEMAGYDASLTSANSRVRCDALVRRYEEVFPGAADTSEPRYWAGLRPSTPSNVPYIGRSKLPNLWINAGHGTLGWTHGAGSGRALAELISGHSPELDFNFIGDVPARRRGRVSGARA